MKSKKLIFALSMLGVISFTATSCGAGILHESSDKLKTYRCDLNHDGRIADFEVDGKVYHEDNLTWAEAYDTLLEEANSMQALSKIADEFGIAKHEIERNSLARYEILHEAEELLMSTNAMVPLYNYMDPYLLKTNVTGLYWTALGYKFFDQMKYTDSSKKEFSVSVGTKAKTLDPGSNSDSSTATILENALVGARKWVKNGDNVRAELGEGCCEVNKFIITNDPSLTREDGYIQFSDCPDLAEENEDEYIGTARYEIKVKDEAKWSDGNSVTAFDFTYAWDRASSNVYSGTPMGIWCSIFDCIRGYNAWNLIGQKDNDDPSSWDADSKENWDSLSAKEQKQWKQAFAARKRTKGGLAGLIIDDTDQNQKSFTVQLINNCDYFEQLLAFLPLIPIPTRYIIEGYDDLYTQNKKASKENTGWWSDKNKFPTNGPLKFEDIHNFESGWIKLSKNEHSMFTTADTIDKLEFKLIDDDSTMYSIYKSNEMQMIDSVASGVIDQAKQLPDWHVADQIGLYYAIFNVNDNTFDIRPNMSEREREDYRGIMNLLINRLDICENVVKSGCTPANGTVSTGITERCIPVWSEDAINPKTGEKGAYIAKRENGKLVSADWHERNLNMRPHLKDGDDYEFVNYRLANRNGKNGGFYPVASKKEEEKPTLETNINTAINIAKGLGINWIGDVENGYFEKFPQVTLVTNSGTGHESIFERMQDYYALFHINLSIETQEWNAFTAAKRNGSFAFARNGWIADYSDPRTYLDIFRSTEANNDTQLGKPGSHRSH